MRRALLDHLVCPEDKLALVLSETELDGDEILEGTLTCSAGHMYTITRGILRLVPAETETSQLITKDSFSVKWGRIPDFGFDEAGRAFYVNWYLERYGFGDLSGLQRFLAGKSMILEAGCGSGRDASMYGENSSAQIVAVDISDSVETAYQHLRHLPRVNVIQADLTRLPFREGTFDYVVSDQVLHHTVDTAASFRYLSRLVKPGGHMAAYVYCKKGPIREFCDDFLRSHYTKASWEECYDFSRRITLLGKALSDLNIEFEVPEDIPILEIKAGRYNLQRFIYYNVFKCYWNDAMDFETNVMTNFDWYHPLQAHRHNPEEVRQWCAESGLEIVHFDVMESGISVLARKP